MIGLLVYLFMIGAAFTGQDIYERRGGESDWKGIAIGWLVGFFLLMLFLIPMYWPK